MYKRKFPKTRTVLDNAASQSSKISSDPPPSVGTLSMSSNSNLDEESPVSPSLLEEFDSFPAKRIALDRHVDDMTDTGSEPLFDDNDDQYLFLKQTLKSCGLHLKCDQNILSVEDYKFLQKLKSKLYNDSDEIGGIDVANNFFTEFEAYHTHKINLKTALSPCKITSENKLEQQQSDSLARLLLQVPQLQSNVIDFLFDKMAEISLEDATDNLVSSVQQWVRLLLKPFKQLNSDMDLRKVCNKFFDTLNVISDLDIKREMVLSIPDIVLDSEDHEAHEELCKLLRNDKDLMPCILETIGQLKISKEELAQIQIDMIPVIHHTPPDGLPSLVKFLIKVDDRKLAIKVVNGLRSELRFSALESSSQITNNNPLSIQLVIFSCIYDGFLSNKLLLDVWMKTINLIPSHVGHKPLDVVIMFLAYSAASNDNSTKNAVLSIIKERLKNEFIRSDIMKETFQTFIPVFKQYFENFIDLFSNLLKTTDHVSIEVVSNMIICCFSNIDQCWCNWIINELLNLLGTSNKLTVENVLNILTELTEKKIEKIQPLASQLMLVFINKICDFSTKNISQVFDMLCKIAYSEASDGINNCSIFQDEINIFVQKELCSPEIISQRIGIIGTIMLTKHMVLLSPDEESISIDKSSEDILLTKKAKTAYSLIELLVTKTQSNIDSQILFFDQFALMLFHGFSLDKTFVYAVSSVLKKNFQYSFLIAANDFKNEKLLVDCSLTFCLDKELDEIIAVNLCPKVIDEIKQNDNAIMGLQSCHSNALMSMFRLVRGLEREDLSEIDALLGCPLVMPSRKTIDEFDMLSPEQQNIVVDSLFHAVNWFREVINCFSYLIKQNDGNKILIRLRTIIYLNKTIKKCLSEMYEPEYIPPPCYYELNVKKPNFNKNKKKLFKPKKNVEKKGKKNVKNKKNILLDSTNASNLNTTNIVENDNDIVLGSEVDISIYQDYLREFDIDTWLILTQNFIINPDPEQNEEFSPEMGPSELCYIMEDVLKKLEHIVFKNKRQSPLAKIKSNDTVGFNNLALIPTKTVIKNFIKLLPFLCTDLEILSEFFKNLLIVNDNILDAPGMFMTNSVDLKHCVGLILKSIQVLFQWKDFESSDTDDLFFNALKKMTNKTDLKSQSSQFRRQMCKKKLISEKISYLKEFQNIVLHLDAAISLVTIIQNLKHLTAEPENNISLRDICWDFLTRQWYSMEGLEESGPKYNNQIIFLLEIYLQCHNDQLKKLVEMVDWVEEEVLTMESKTDRLKTLPTINKMNFKCLIKVILNTLLGSVKNSLKSAENDFDRLAIWQSTIYIMEKNVQIIKKQDLRNNLLIFVKGCISLLKLFLAEGMNVCQNVFKLRTTEVSKVLKSLQVITRYIQNICNYTKVIKDDALSNCLPNIRGILEALILKVKNLIVINGCTDALFMGIMKNIDIRGDEILSQNESEDEDENDNDNENDDDGDDDENISEDKTEANDLNSILGENKTLVEDEDSDDNSQIL